MEETNAQRFKRHLKAYEDATKRQNAAIFEAGKAANAGNDEAAAKWDAEAEAARKSAKLNYLMALRYSSLSRQSGEG